jgi:inorganic pyrophosphatase/exopolyphosphatase
MEIGIIGNEGCDADSIVCAVAYSKLKNMKKEENQHFTPFFQCDQIDMRLDFTSVCKEAGIPHQDLVKSLNDPSSKSIKEWILVDHHFPTEAFSKKIDDFKITEIVDHHKVTTDKAKILETDLNKKGAYENKTIGSCSTLIAKRFLRFIIGNRDSLQDLLPYLKMLLFTILIDTSNLEEASKTTDEDKEVVSELKRICNMDDETLKPIYENLRNSKFSPDFWNNQPLDVILSYDYKNGFNIKMKDVNVRYGMASVLRSIKDEELKSIIEYYKSIGEEAFAINTSTLQGSKQLLLFNFPQLVVEKLIENSNGSYKELKKVDEDGISIIRFDVPAKFSRKTFIPEVDAAVKMANEILDKPAFSFGKRKSNLRKKTSRNSRKKSKSRVSRKKSSNPRKKTSRNSRKKNSRKKSKSKVKSPKKTKKPSRKDSRKNSRKARK